MGVRRAEVSRSDILLSAYQNAKRKIQHHSRRFSSPLWRISHDTHRILLPCRGRLAFGILQSRIQTLKHVRSCLWAHFQISKPEFCSSLGKENSAEQISKSRSRMQMPKSEFRSYLEIWRIQEILKKIGCKIHLVNSDTDKPKHWKNDMCWIEYSHQGTYTVAKSSVSRYPKRPQSLSEWHVDQSYDTLNMAFSNACVRIDSRSRCQQNVLAATYSFFAQFFYPISWCTSWR